MHHVGWLLWASMALGLIACGGSGAVDPKVDGTPIPEQDLRELLKTTSESQRAALKDGHVTFAEYEAAVLATVGCVEAAGFRLREPLHLIARRQYQWSFEIGPTREDLERFRPLNIGCWQEHLSAVSGVWTYQNQPSEEHRQRARDALGQCLREAGYEVSEHPSEKELAAFAMGGNPAFPVCAKRIAEEFELVNFGVVGGN